MNPQQNAEIQTPEVRREAFLSRLPQKDQANLRNISERFKQTMEAEGRKGALVVVGGALNKPLPRKDIDILIVLQPHPQDVQKNNSTELAYAQEDFKTFQHIVEKMSDQDPALQITAIEPAMDEEFESPHILKSDGSIVVTSNEEGITPIEFIRMREHGNYQEIAAKGGRPFVTLVHK
ncbi:MAG: hypothetical protein Q7R82_00655 [Candidatus Daviesbacteria bacterium]|nr:hypothetical protein [Candidatus Daviesbacteria bacterium]